MNSVPYSKVTIIVETGDDIKTIVVEKAKDLDFNTVTMRDDDGRINKATVIFEFEPLKNEDYQYYTVTNEVKE